MGKLDWGQCILKKIKKGEMNEKNIETQILMHKCTFACTDMFKIKWECVFFLNICGVLQEYLVS